MGKKRVERKEIRFFEFTELASGNERHAWSNVGDIKAEIQKVGGLNENNQN